MSENVKTHYNDSELEEFRAIIEEKIKSAKEDIAILKANSHSENDTSDTYSPSKSYEDGAKYLALQNNALLIGRLEKFIRDLEFALIRIENKTYGICKATKQLISKERLRVVPHATMTIEAKMNRS